MAVTLFTISSQDQDKLFEKPNYEKWSKYDYWKLEDFAALRVGIDPNQMTCVITLVEKIYKSIEISVGVLEDFEHKAHQKYQGYKTFLAELERSTLFKSPTAQSSPHDCIQWAIKSQIALPVELSDHINNPSNDEASENKTIQQLRAKLSGRTKELHTVQKCLTALVLSKKSTFFEDPSAMTPLLTILLNNGCSVDDATLRNHLNAGLTQIKKQK